MESKYFKMKELVSTKVYELLGERAGKYISNDIILFLDTLREDLGVPILVNRPRYNITQRGLRTTIDSIVIDKVKDEKLYLSAHMFGRAVDFEVPGMDMREVYNKIVENPKKYFMITRIESPDVTLPRGYIHVDNMETGQEGIYVFRP